MPLDLSRLTALVYDNGLYPFVATKLTEQFGAVKYFTPYMAAPFSLSKDKGPGVGLPGVERVYDFFAELDGADVVIFPDCGMGDLQMWLRKLGHRVWGSGASEILELDRFALKLFLAEQGLPMPETWVASGIDELRQHLMDPRNRDQFVKINETRGDFETYGHKGPWSAEEWLKRVDLQLGPLGKTLQFLIEAKIGDAVEVGVDGFNIDGQWAPLIGYGYEDKDNAYVGRSVVSEDLPSVLADINAKLGAVLGQLGCRSMLSTEVRVTPDGTGYLLDPCLRAPSPPSESMLEQYDNWPEIFYAGAGGEMVEPNPKAEFCAQIILRSPVAEHHFLPIRFPERNRPFVKLHGHCRIDNVDCVVSLGIDIIGSAVGIGATQEEAEQQALDVAESIEADELHYDVHGFEALRGPIELGKERGVPWPTP